MTRPALRLFAASRSPLLRPGVLGVFVLGLSAILGVAASPAPAARDQAGPVVIVQIRDEIDLGLAPYLKRALNEAVRADARAVILEIDTPGGRLDAALQMRQAVLDAPVRTIAYVDGNAFSAGALVALAANEMYLDPGAVVGAATPVTGAGRPADEKTMSAVRSTFRATAELRGRDPRLAEAMVDPSVGIEGLIAPGRLLTLTAAEAQTWGYADGIAVDRPALLQAIGLADTPVREVAPALAETAVRVVTSPVVASLLIAAGVLLIVGDVLIGGAGATSVVGFGLLALFFWGHMLAGLAGWEGVALVGAGLLLLALEAFVLPGFGVAGILGLGAFIAGLILSMIGGEIVTDADLARAATTVGYTIVALLVGGGGLLWSLARSSGTPGFGGLVLRAHLGGEQIGDRSDPDGAARGWPRLLGARGVTESELRPGGVARVNGARIDVVTQGEYLPPGTPIEVVTDQGYRRVVRRFEGAQGTATRAYPRRVQ